MNPPVGSLGGARRVSGASFFLLMALLVFGCLLATPEGLFAASDDELLVLPMPPGGKKSVVQPSQAPASFSLVNDGAELLASGQTEKAEEVLREAVAKYPDLPEAAYNLGLAQSFNGRFADAEQSQKRALTKNPQFAAAHLALGNALYALGRSQEALDSFMQAETLASDPEILSSAAFNRAMALGKLNRYIEAESAFSDCLARNPDDSTPAFQIGVMKLRQKKWTDALGWLDSAADALPLEVAILRSKALVKLARRGEAETALGGAEKTLAAANVADDVRLSLGKIIADLRKELASTPPAK